MSTENFVTDRITHALSESHRATWFVSFRVNIELEAGDGGMAITDPIDCRAAKLLCMSCRQCFRQYLAGSVKATTLNFTELQVSQ